MELALSALIKWLSMKSDSVLRIIERRNRILRYKQFKMAIKTKKIVVL